MNELVLDEDLAHATYSFRFMEVTSMILREITA